MFKSKEKRTLANQIAIRIAYAAIALVAWTTLYYGLGEWIGLLLNTWGKITDAKGFKSVLDVIASCLALRLAVVSVLPSSSIKRRFAVLKQYINFYFLSQGIIHMVKLCNSANTNVPQEMIIASSFIIAISLLHTLMRIINTYVTTRTAKTIVGLISTKDDLSLGNLNKFIIAFDEKDVDDFLATINSSQDLVTDNYKPYVDMLNLEMTKTKTTDGNVTGSISFILGFKMFRNSKLKWLRTFHFPLTSILEPINFKSAVCNKLLEKTTIAKAPKTDET